MTDKTKIILTGGGIALLVVALTGGGLWWHDSHKKPAVSNINTLADQSSSSDSGGLSVSGSSGAQNLGQLGGNGSQSSQNLSGNGNSSGGSSSGFLNDLDPSTFGQYDKYKGNKDALFADIQAGSGTAIGKGSKASVYYKGWLTNGALVDQSPVSSGGVPQAFSFTEGANQVIPGWEEGLYGMKAGGKRLLIVPPAVGYGSQGQGAVPANAVLVFEIQLVSVQ